MFMFIVLAWIAAVKTYLKSTHKNRCYKNVQIVIQYKVYVEYVKRLFKWIKDRNFKIVWKLE